MPAWTPFAGWMAFRYLDVAGGPTQSFAIGYKITDDSGEAWSARFARFKAGDKGAFVGGASLMRGAVPALVANLDLEAGKTVFVSALSSGERTASHDGRMHVIARRCAEDLGARFELAALTKQAHRPIHNFYGAAERDAELDKAAYVAVSLRAKNVLVFDDLITRGGTLSKITQAILATNPGATVYGVALAKTERRSWDPNVSNGHVTPRWSALWAQGEQRYQEKLRAGAKP